MFDLIFRDTWGRLIISIFSLVSKSAPPGAQGCPRAAPGLLFHLFCHGFSLILSWICPAIKLNLSLILSWKTKKQIPPCPKSGRVPCEKRPRKPRKKHAIALPSQRGTDDVNNQAEYCVKNPPGNPDKKNALAVPFERCTDDK